MPPVRISSDTLHQMLLDTRSDIARVEKQMDLQASTVNNTSLLLQTVNSKLDRALTMEAAVVEMRSELDRAKGMGIMGALLLASLEGVIGLIAFFRPKL